MPRFFIDSGDCTEKDRITLTGENARHISLSLRSRVGDMLTLCDGKGTDYECVISDITKNEVILSVESTSPCRAEPDIEVTLYQALIKSDKFDTVVQKAVELGVTRIVPVLSERCVSRPDDKSLEKKIQRWNKISLEAAMQSGRGKVPEVLPAVEFADAIDGMLKTDFYFVCYEDEKDISLKQLCENASKTKRIYKTYSFFVGPEGGISRKEADYAKDNGVTCISLGKRILRTETAPLCVLSALMYESGNLG